MFIRALVLSTAAAASGLSAVARPGTTKPQPAAQATAASGLAHVEVRGNGPVPMILIPGLNCDWTVFDAFMSRNAAKYTMYAVRLPGFGGSAAPPVAVDSTFRDGAWLAASEQAVVALIKDKKLDKPVIAGHSLGGHLALRIGSHHPDLVRAVIDLDGYPTLPYAGDTPPTVDERAKQAEAMAKNIPIDAEGYKKYISQFASGSVTSPERAKKLIEMMSVVPRDTMVRYFSELVVADPTADLRANKARTLVIAAIAPVPQAMKGRIHSTWEKLAAPIGNCTTVFFENSRHFLMDDAPAELDAAVAAFVDGKPVPGKAAKSAEPDSENTPKPEGGKP